MLFSLQGFHTNKKKSPGNALRQLWVFIFACWTQWMFLGLASLCYQSECHSRKKRHPKRRVECVCARLYTYACTIFIRFNQRVHIQGLETALWLHNRTWWSGCNGPCLSVVWSSQKGTEQTVNLIAESRRRRWSQRGLLNWVTRLCSNISTAYSSKINQPAPQLLLF